MRARSGITRRGSGRHGGSPIWASSTRSTRPGGRVALPRRHATGRHVVAERLAHEREQLRPLPPIVFDATRRRSSRVPTDGYLKLGRCFYPCPGGTHPAARRAALGPRPGLRIDHHGRTVARYERSYEHGLWLPPPRLRPEPPPVAQLIRIDGPDIVPPALSDYAELCA